MLRKLAPLAILTFFGTSCTTAWISAYKREQERKEAIRPEAANSDVAPIAPITVIRTEVWVSEHFAASPEARERQSRERIDAANVWMNALGARFEVLRTRTWSLPKDVGLREALGALQREAPGDEADFVLGFLPELGAFSNSLHELGMAAEPGKHAVVRAFDDTHELEALRQALQLTTRAEEERIFEERKRHKSAVVVLHEWAHGLGATHDPRATDGFMQPIYDVDMARFSPANQQIIELGTRLRYGPNADASLWRQAVADTLRARPELDADQKQLLAYLESTGAVAAATTKVESAPKEEPLPTNPPGDPWEGVRQADLQKLNGIFQRAQNDAPGAWEDFNKMREPYRDHPAMAALGCTLARQAMVPGALDVCKVARLVAKEDPRPVLELLEEVSKTGPSVEGFALLDEACARRFHESDNVSLRLAHWAVYYGAFSCASIALRRVKEPGSLGPVSERLQYQRNELGVPEDTKMTAADELGMRLAVVRVDQLIREKKLREAEAAAKKATSQWPMPATWSVTCEVYGHRGHYRTARQWCERSLLAFPTDARAHFLMGVLELRANKKASAESHLDRAVLANPYQDRAWELLAQVASAEQKAKLRERYRSLRDSAPTF